MLSQGTKRKSFRKLLTTNQKYAIIYTESEREVIIMYKLITAGNKVIAEVENRMEAKVMAYQFANNNCTFVKIYHNDIFLAVIC